MVGAALRVAIISSVVLMRWSFVRSMVPATISSVVVILVAQIYVARMCVARIYVVRIYVVACRFSSVVVVSVARIYVARMCVARIYVVRIYVARVYAVVCRFSSVVVVSVARGFCRCSLVDRRFEVEVMAQPRRYSRRRERCARGWCVDTARCCALGRIYQGNASVPRSSPRCGAPGYPRARGRPSLCCSW